MWKVRTGQDECRMWSIQYEGGMNGVDILRHWGYVPLGDCFDRKIRVKRALIEKTHYSMTRITHSYHTVKSVESSW